ncbi:MAG: lipoate--protein ligase family protein [Paludibacter sp.]|jgi:lipoate-protein ligase A
MTDDTKIIVSDSQDPAFNLALEECLFNREEAYALFYVNESSVIIGSNQIWENEVDRQFCYQHQIPVYRRISGGGAVYHDLGNLNYSFIFNKKKQKYNLNALYLKPIVVALASFGIHPVIGKRKDLWLPDGMHKISGTASHFTGSRVMHHGTILYDSDLKMLRGALLSSLKIKDVKGIPSVVSPVKNIKTYLKESQLKVFSASDFFDKMIEQVGKVLGSQHVVIPDEQMIAAIETLAKDKYRLESWNKRK